MFLLPGWFIQVHILGDSYTDEGYTVEQIPLCLDAPGSHQVRTNIEISLGHSLSRWDIVSSDGTEVEGKITTTNLMGWKQRPKKGKQWTKKENNELKRKKNNQKGKQWTKKENNELKKEKD